MRRGGVRKSGWLGAAALCMAAAALCGLLWRGKPPAEEGEQPPEAPKAEAAWVPFSWGKEPLPESYDSRLFGRAPQVRDQGSFGTCWAFASLAALESSLLPQEEAEFSVDHMSLQNSFNLSQDQGGEYSMSMAYLLAWQGPVLESEDPYGDGLSPEGLSACKHVQEIQILPSKDYEAIKRAVYEKGGVQSSLYTDLTQLGQESRFYNADTNAYCYSGPEKANHDSVIVGWDDHFPKENFREMPEGDGAFLCMNSWGREFGDQGYFYVSYYDSNIGVCNISYTGIWPADHYDRIYQTDLCGWMGQIGYGQETVWFANVYQAQSEEKLEAAGFYATMEDTSYEIYVADRLEGEGSKGLSEASLAASGQLRYSGFYTVPLEEGIQLTAGERFAVIVRITTPGAVHPAAIEYDGGSGVAHVDLSDGEGYLSSDGQSWERVEETMNCNLCLKAYTSLASEFE